MWGGGGLHEGGGAKGGMRDMGSWERGAEGC